MLVSCKTLRGFSLIEVMVSLVIFSIIMLAITQTFTRSFASYRNAKNIQNDVANAQFALNLLSKELRTSSITSPASNVLVSSVQFYDYSQGMCFAYWINAGALQVMKISVPNFDACDTLVGPYLYKTITTGTVTGGFIITPSDFTSGSKTVGKVTISLQISEGTNHPVRIQTTVSLRDYGYVGLF